MTAGLSDARKFQHYRRDIRDVMQHAEAGRQVEGGIRQRQAAIGRWFNVGRRRAEHVRPHERGGRINDGDRIDLADERPQLVAVSAAEAEQRVETLVAYESKRVSIVQGVIAVAIRIGVSCAKIRIALFLVAKPRFDTRRIEVVAIELLAAKIAAASNPRACLPWLPAIRGFIERLVGHTAPPIPSIPRAPFSHRPAP